MAPKKLALLVGSPYGGLQGTWNDVQLMADVLENRGFRVTRRYAEEATRDGIKSAWKQLISESSTDDVIAIYFSGHGGLVAPEPKDLDAETKSPQRFQFIVPWDYDKTTPDDFRGLTHLEISQMLRDTTAKTQNVTIILDCCHSARLARNPICPDESSPKGLLAVQHHNILEHIDQLQKNGSLREDGEDRVIKDNLHAVRVAASATDETAWEYKSRDGRYIGVFTEALVHAIKEAGDREVTWRTALRRVSGLVSVAFPQHPEVAGPRTRVLFSTEVSESGAIPVGRLDKQHAIIDGGRVAGVRVGNVYDILPNGSERVKSEEQIATAEIVGILGFEAKAKLTFTAQHRDIPSEGALAFLRSIAIQRFRVSIPHDSPDIQARFAYSDFLTCEGDDPLLAELRREAKEFVLCNGRGLKLASCQFSDDLSMQKAVDDLIHEAEMLARAKHFLGQVGGVGREKLEHDVKMEFGVIWDGEPKAYEQDGTALVIENERIYISLRNNGRSDVYVSVFDVCVTGRISLLSGDHPKGIQLRSGDSCTLGEDNFGDLEGLLVGWREAIPKQGTVEEFLVFVISKEPVDLSIVANPDAGARGDVPADVTGLEWLKFHLAYGIGRYTQPQRRGRVVPYDIKYIGFSLQPEPSPHLAAQKGTPVSREHHEDIMSY